MELLAGESYSLLPCAFTFEVAEQMHLMCGRALLECTRSFLPAMIEGNNEKYVPTPAFEKVVVAFIDESGVEGYGVCIFCLSFPRSED